MSSSSSTHSSLKQVMNKVGKAGSAVRALASSSPHTNSGSSGGGGGQQGTQQNAGIIHGQALNCYKAVHDYISKMTSQVQGMKALLLDSETTSMVGLVYSQSDLISKDVFLVESLGVIADGMVEEAVEEAELKRNLKKGSIMKSDNVGINEQNMQHLKAIVFMQPSSLSLSKLAILLRSPRYKEYHVFFSNIAPSGFLELLSASDPHDRIQQVNEYYFDYYVVTPSLIHMNADTVTAGAALKLNNTYSSKTSWCYDRDFQGCLSLLLSLKKHPSIRYMAGSDVCKRLAYDLNQQMKDEQELFTFQNEPTLLLLLDRSEDVVTPLLTQWTYQSMVHELLGIKLNRVLLETKGVPTPPPQQSTTTKPAVKSAEEKALDALHDVILSPEHDDFFRSSMFVNFGELGIRVKKLVAEFQSLTKTQTKLETLADMQRFVDNYPQFKLQSVTVAKHVSVMGEISKLVNTRKLLTVSAIEQELVCCPSGTSEHHDVCAKVLKLLEDREVTFEDKMRVVILYALRYEHAGHGNNLPQLIGLLRAHARVAGYSETIVEVVDKMLALSGGHTRSWPLFAQDQDAITLKSVVKSIQTGVKGIENIYTQHKSMMYDILSTLFAGELKTVQFPFVEQGANPKTIYRRVIVYVVGGCTYEEYAGVESLLNSPRYKGNYTAVVGGSCIHNSSTFLREIAEFESYKLRNEEPINASAYATRNNYQNNPYNNNTAATNNHPSNNNGPYQQVPQQQYQHPHYQPQQPQPYQQQPPPQQYQPQYQQPPADRRSYPPPQSASGPSYGPVDSAPQSRPQPARNSMPPPSSTPQRPAGAQRPMQPQQQAQHRTPGPNVGRPPPRTSNQQYGLGE